MAFNKSLFTPIREKPLSVHEKVVREIKSAISRGQLQPGDKLPPERELARMLGVSRTSLREALKLLELSGILIIKHGQGVFISEQNSTDFIQKLINHIFMDNQKIRELFEIRKVLETQAVIWACENGKDDQFEEIIELLQTTEDLLKENDESDYFPILAEQDAKFHQMIISAAGNSILNMLMQTMFDLLADNRSMTALIPGRPEKSLDDHILIAKALKKRDKVAAKNAMLRHLENVERDVLNHPAC